MNINFIPVSSSSNIGDRTNNESSNASNCESMDRAAHRSQSPNEMLISLRSDYEQAYLPEEFSNTYQESRLADRSKEDVEQKQDSEDTRFAFELDEHLHGNDTIQPIQNYIDPHGARPHGARTTAFSEQFCDDPGIIYKSEDTEPQTYRHRHEAKFPDRSRTELNRNNLYEVEPPKQNDSDDDLSETLDEKDRIIRQLEDNMLKMAANMETLKNANKQQSEYIRQLLEKQRAAERNASSSSENQIKSLELDIKLLNVQVRMYKEDFLKEKMEKDLKQKTIESLSLQVQTLQDELMKASRRHTAAPSVFRNLETTAPSVFRNLEVDTLEVGIWKSFSSPIREEEEIQTKHFS